MSPYAVTDSVHTELAEVPAPLVNLSIRDATRADLPTLLALYEELAVQGDAEVSAEMASERFDELTSGSRHRIHVAESDGEIVGTFTLVFLGWASRTARATRASSKTWSSHRPCKAVASATA